MEGGTEKSNGKNKLLKGGITNKGIGIKDEMKKGNKE